MCDVPSIAVFCSESIEWFPGTVSKFFLKLLVTIPVAPIITGIIVYFVWLLTLREEKKLRVFENMVLRRIFGPRRRGNGGMEEIAQRGAK